MRIESPAEQELITRLLMGGQWDWYWVDGSDSAKEGVWRFGNGELMQYFNWQKPNPSNSRGSEHWLAVWAADGRWNDLDAKAGVDVGYVCEWDQ